MNMRMIISALIGFGITALCAQGKVESGGQTEVSITIELDGVGDTLVTLVKYQTANLSLYHATVPPERYTAVPANAKANFRITGGDSPFVFSLRRRPTDDEYLLIYYIAESGDSVTVHVNGDRLRFSGRGAEKYRCKYEMDSIISTGSRLADEQFREIYSDIDLHTPRGLFLMQRHYIDYAAEMASRLEIRLDSCCGYIGDDAQAILAADAFGKSWSRAIRDTRYLLDAGTWKNQSRYVDSLRLLLARYPAYLGNVDSDLLAQSNPYVLYCYNRSQLDAKLAGYTIAPWLVMAREFEGLLADKLITTSTLSNFRRIPQGDSLIEAMIPRIREAVLVNALKNLKEDVGNGVQAYDFSLRDVNGKLVRLSDFKGKNVLLHFFFNGCAPCIHYYRNTLAPVEQKFANHEQIVFVSISLDKDRASWLKGVESGNLTSETAVNLFTEGKKFDHPAVQAYRVSGAPTVLFIDKAGKIRSNSIEELGGTIGNPGRLIAFIERYID